MGTCCGGGLGNSSGSTLLLGRSHKTAQTGTSLHKSVETSLQRSVIDLRYPHHRFHPPEGERCLEFGTREPEKTWEIAGPPLLPWCVIVVSAWCRETITWAHRPGAGVETWLFAGQEPCCLSSQSGVRFPPHPGTKASVESESVLHAPRTENCSHYPSHAGGTVRPAEVATVPHALSRPGSPWADYPTGQRGEVDLGDCPDGRDQSPLYLQVGAAVSRGRARGLGRQAGPGIPVRAAPLPPGDAARRLPPRQWRTREVSVVDGNKFRADLTGESYAAIAGRDVPAPGTGAQHSRGAA